MPGASGVALDGSGNIYVALTGQNQVLKETLAGGSYVPSVIPTSTLNSPHGIAVDSGGNLFIADTGNGRVLMEIPSGAGYMETAVNYSSPNPVGISLGTR